MVLESDGWQVDEAADGETAVANMRVSPPDVVIISWHPPRMGGLHLLQTLLVDDDLRVVPRVVISSGDDPVERRFTLGLNAAAWLSAPVSERRLLAAVWDHHSDTTSVPDETTVGPDVG